MASIEFSGIAVGMHATDAMLKKSPISLLKCGTISEARYLTIIGGSTASVLESLHEGLYWGKDHIVDYTFLPDVHPQLHDAVMGKRGHAAAGALAVIEAASVSCIIQATEMALKGTTVDLIEIRLGDTEMAGRGLTIFQGELHDIEAARDIARTFLNGKSVQTIDRILTAPHEGTLEQVDKSTMYLQSKDLELDGEHIT